jgi:hypothetical protein
MSSAKLSDRIKEAKSTDQEIETLTERLNENLKINAQSTNQPDKASTSENEDEDDWERLADKELDIPSEKSKVKTSANESPILELYDFDTRIQMHQLVKDFTSIVDPTHIFPFRPKMVGQSLMFTFDNPKHGISGLP